MFYFLKHYIVTFYRAYFKKNITFSLVNVFGLTVGFTFILIVFAYLKFEWSFDKFHTKYDDIYRITMDWIDDGKEDKSAAVHSPLYAVLKEELPAEAIVTRVYPTSALIKSDKTNKIKEDNILFVDADFYKVFDFSKNQNIIQSFNEPFSAIITKSYAIKYFNSEDVFDKTLEYDNGSEKFEVYIKGVINDLPANSHIEGNIFIVFNSLERIMPRINSWYYPQMFFYVYSKQHIEINDLIQKHLPKRLLAQKRKFELQPISEIHLDNSYSDDWSKTTNRRNISILLFIAILVILITIINYSNLLIAVALNRQKEITIKKINGASRYQLIKQFLFESFSLSLISFICAIFLSLIVLQFLSLSLFGIHYSSLIKFNLSYIIYFSMAMIALGILTSIYPAFKIFSRSLKINKMRSFNYRSLLVGLQFFISGALLIFTIILNKQVEFLNNSPLGFKNDLVIVELNDTYSQAKQNILKQSLLAETAVSSVSLTSSIPHQDRFYGQQIKIGNNEEMTTINTLSSDEDILKTYDIERVRGKSFTDVSSSFLEKSFLINEAASKEFNIKNPINQKVSFSYYTDSLVNVEGEIIGVVKDFKYQTLDKKVEPLLIYINKHPYYSDFLSIKLNDMESGLNVISEKWKTFNPEIPLDSYILKDAIATSYKSENKLNLILFLFVIVSLCLTSIGILGISFYDIRNKTKEITVRKILGASFFNLNMYYLKKFIFIIIGFTVFAFPLVYVLGSKWLESYAYKIKLEPNIFIIGLFVNIILGSVVVILSMYSILKLNIVENVSEN